MPKRPLIHVADLLFNRVLAITPAKCDVILSAIGDRLGLSAEALPLLFGRLDDDDQDDPDDNSFEL